MKATQSTNEFVTKKQFELSMEKIDERFNKMDERFDDVLNKFDDFIGQFQEMKIEMTLLPHQVTEVRDMSEDHEKHITRLEHGTKSL